MEVFNWGKFDVTHTYDINTYVYIKCVAYNKGIIEYIDHQGYDNKRVYVNGVETVEDWNAATKTGVYKSLYTTEYNANYKEYTDNPNMHMPLPINYDGIFNLLHVFADRTISYLGKVTASNKKIIQELELNAMQMLLNNIKKIL